MKTEEIYYRRAILPDLKKLSVLYMQVYIQTYGKEGVSDEFANFITRQFSEARLGELIGQQNDKIIVAEYKGNLVGVAELDYDKRTPIGEMVGAELSKLYVLEWFCGRGVGYELMQQAEKVLKSKGEKLMWVWVLESNNRAVSFYERQQFRHIGNASFQMEVNSYDNKVFVKELL
jgi:diamine N-acetyltransferase